VSRPRARSTTLALRTRRRTPDVNACEAAKLKAAAKAAAGVFNCTAKSAQKGKPADPNCTLVVPGPGGDRAKLQDKLDAAFAKADASGPCAGNSLTLGFAIELACHFQIPIADSAGTAAGLVCY
jgi:hypothetical protein